VRPFHCTEVGLTPAIIPNADNSGAQFLVVGTACALSRSNIIETNFVIYFIVKVVHVRTGLRFAIMYGLWNQLHPATCNLLAKMKMVYGVYATTLKL
jgi:hypothetical protein